MYKARFQEVAPDPLIRESLFMLFSSFPVETLQALRHVEQRFKVVLDGKTKNGIQEVRGSIPLSSTKIPVGE